MSKKELVSPIAYLASARQAWTRGVIAGDWEAPADTPQPIVKPDMPELVTPEKPMTQDDVAWRIKTIFEIARQRRIKQRIELRDSGWRPNALDPMAGTSMAERVDRLYEGGVSLSAERSFR